MSLPEWFGGREQWNRVYQPPALGRSRVHLGVVASKFAAEPADEAAARLRRAQLIDSVLRTLAVRCRPWQLGPVCKGVQRA